jgi:putative heme-binding domain-containing protein
VLLHNGKTLQGRVAAETPETLTIQTNESFGEPKTILKSEIEDQFPGKTSLMPAGLLNTLQREQILDLLSYLVQGEDG